MNREKDRLDSEGILSLGIKRTRICDDLSVVIEICQSLQADFERGFKIIQDLRSPLSSLETFFITLRSDAKFWRSQLYRLRSLASSITYGHINNVNDLFHTLKKSFLVTQNAVDTWIELLARGVINEADCMLELLVARSNIALKPSTKPVSTVIKTSSDSRFREVFNPLYSYIQGSLDAAMQYLKEHVLLLGLDSQKQYRRFLTLLVLWTPEKSKLIHTILANSHRWSLSQAVLIVVRKVIEDPSRLSIMQQRMVDANCLRRARFIKARDGFYHQDRPSTTDSADQSTISGRIGENDSHDHRQEPPTVEGTWNSIEPTMFTSTRPSSFLKLIPTSIRGVMAGSNKDYPGVPDGSKKATHSNCPLCFRSLSPKIYHNWRHHVQQDVLPFTCIFERCLTPLILYPSATKWLAHMEKEHSSRQWTCYGCSPVEPRVFDTLESYKEHFKTTRQHIGITTEAQIETLAPMNEMPRPLEFTLCPLCQKCENVELNADGYSTLQDHITQHMFSFAMRSLLPDAEINSYEEDEGKASDDAVDGDSERYIELDTPSTLDFHSVASDESREVDTDRISPELDEGVIDYHKADVGSLPLVAHDVPPYGYFKDQKRTFFSVSHPALGRERIERYRWRKVLILASAMAAFRNTRKRTKQSRWRKPLLLSSAIASFLACGRRRRSRSMCTFCLPISNFFENLDIRITYKSFEYHNARQDIYISARAGCSLCKMFLRAAFGEPSESDYEKLKQDLEGDEKAPFSIAFLGSTGDKTLNLRKGSTDLCQFEIYCDRYGALSRINWTSYRSLFTDPSSEDALDYLRDCLEVCEANHENCHPHRRSRPTRLLDVGHPIKLVDSFLQSPKFLFFSACWGAVPALRLNRNNYSQLKTKIASRDLPRTIRDAIEVARAMQIPYIWVDSLCIVQDDVEDWKVEVSRLHEYLESCMFTLGAANSRDLSSGFLNMRDERRCYTFNARTVGSLPGAKVHFRPSLPSAWDSISHDPLLTRMWTLQELTLCSRSILFGSSMILWNCRTHMISDASEIAWPPLWDQRLDLNTILADAPSVEDEILQDRRVVSSQWLMKSSKDVVDAQKIYNAWHKIVEASSHLKLAYEKDRLPALTALRSSAQKKLTGDRYLAGLWKNNLPCDLLWHKRSTPLKKIAHSSTPSWSWAAYAGPISYSMIDSFYIRPKYINALRCSIEIRETEATTIEKASPLDQGESIQLCIGAVYLSYDELIRRLNSGSIRNVEWKEERDLTNDITPLASGTRAESPQNELHLDSSKKLQGLKMASEPCDLTVLLIYEFVHEDCVVSSMLLVQRAEGSTWQRVGVCTLVSSTSPYALEHVGNAPQLFELI